MASAQTVDSVVSSCATLWPAARQAALSMGFSRQEYWSGLPYPETIIISKLAFY